MISLPFFSYRFTFKWQFTAVMVVLTCVLMSLSYWQINRGQEKEKLMRLASLQLARSPIHWDDHTPAPSQYRPIIVKGRYLPQIFFLDNQFYQHQIGFNIILALELDTRKTLLVDCGWVPAVNRQLPVYEIPKNVQQLEGYVYYPSAKSLVLGPIIEGQGKNKYIIERVDIKLISNVLHKSVYPFIIRLQVNSNHLVQNWPVVNMLPQRHYAYALQWFIMACIAVIIYFALSIQKI